MFPSCHKKISYVVIPFKYKYFINMETENAVQNHTIIAQ